jgi:dTDP-4-dehydrorhamnose 3,5-epimerase
MEPVPESRIAGLTLTPLRQIVDERGAVLHMLRCDAPDFVRFGEVYFSEVKPGAVKAWKRHRRQTQTFAVPVGRLKIVLFDDRPESATRSVLQTLELGRPDAYFRLRIPPGIWYGFAAASDVPALITNVADLPHDPQESELIPADSPTIPYRWSQGPKGE